MTIKNLGKPSLPELRALIENGSRLVQYQYCISFIVISLKKYSPVYLVKPDENRIRKGLKYSVLSAILGWWGFPSGLIYTTDCLVQNFKGGVDITNSVLTKPKFAVPENELA